MVSRPLARDFDMYRIGDFTLSNNVWNRQLLVNGIDFKQTIAFDPCSFPGRTVFNWDWPILTEKRVLSYPEVIAGKKPWDVDGSFSYMARIDTIRDLSVTYDLSLKGDSANHNVAFEFWLTDKLNGTAKDITTEVMIWVDDGTFSPAGKVVGRYDSLLGGADIYFEKDFGDAASGGTTWDYIAIRLDDQKLRGTLDLDDLMRFLVSKGLVHKADYFAGYELGAEVLGGKASMTIHKLADQFWQVGATAGNDRFSGTLADDGFNGKGGHDTIKGLAGNDILSGGAGWDNLHGGEGDDRLLGGDGRDALFGDLGFDILDGGTGRDTMTGGIGNDTYLVDNFCDQIIELFFEGFDTVKSTANYALPAYVDMLELLGTASLTGTGNADTNFMLGNFGSNRLYGRAGDDTIDGQAGDDALYGQAGRDKLVGAEGKDLLDGGLGTDTLTGGAGADSFRFSFGSLQPGQADSITDFNVPNDRILLDQSAFARLPCAEGTLGKAQFVLGSHATGALQRIVYELATGKIFYDADGSGTGAKVHFATVAPGTALNNLDFFVT